MERIRQKIGRIKEYIKYIEGLADACEKKFAIDPVYRGALLYYLYLMADTCIALAEMIIKARALRPPQSYSDAFDILGENEILDKEFAYSFAKIAGFRNLLAHDYEKVDAQKICHDILKKMPDVKKFLRQIQSALNL
ncbi:MAG: DUF86 domain-containing protein [candidate division KSB1 bacterium]|nr:DUF86 domain-containing protein [candidate division KSB1 bacterium]MDZ7355962.1 DUF86 domain-containing protein [candidate division KSB1 bacterium]MDZ7400704.1 DUF86 domain-containing protein [candidate division KSB1 bacterium]